MEWKYVSFNQTLPFDTGYFTTRFIAQASTGWVEIRDARMDFVFLQEDSKTPFGHTLPLQTGNLRFGVITGYAYFEYEGTGSLKVNDQTFDLSSPETASWYALPFPNISSATLSGINIGALVVTKTPLSIGLDDSTLDGGLNPSMNVRFGGGVMFTRPFALGYELRSSRNSFSSHPTLDGMTIFLDVLPGDYTISIPGTSIARIAYLASLGFILGIIADTRRNTIGALLRTLKKKLTSVMIYSRVSRMSIE